MPTSQILVNGAGLKKIFQRRILLFSRGKQGMTLIGLLKRPEPLHQGGIAVRFSLPEKEYQLLQKAGGHATDQVFDLTGIDVGLLRILP